LPPGAKTDRIREVHPTYVLVVKGLSRLPVTEEIAGSNPVEHARIIKNYLHGSFFIQHCTTIDFF
jgi:hypothetical protein